MVPWTPESTGIPGIPNACSQSSFSQVYRLSIPLIPQHRGLRTRRDEAQFNVHIRLGISETLFHLTSQKIGQFLDWDRGSGQDGFVAGAGW